jgi:penicillin-binding protein 1C
VAASGRRPPAPAPRFGVASPPAGATYLIDPTLRREFQTLPLRVTASPSQRVEWTVDGRFIGHADSDSALEWPLVPGTHRFTARGARGEVASATVTVR